MLQYSTYSVISPEGCAAILWKSAEKRRRGGREPRHHRHAVEGPGRDRQGDHRAAGAARTAIPRTPAKSLKKAIQDSLRSLQDLSVDELLERRQERWVNYGKFKELAE